MTVYTGQIFPYFSQPGIGETTTLEVTTEVIPSGETLEFELVTPRIYQLNSIVTSCACWLRVYGTSYARFYDNRTSPGPPFPSVGTGFAAEVLTVSNNLVTNFYPPAEVQVETVYTLFKVRNDSGINQEITITLEVIIGEYGIIPSSPPYGCRVSVDTVGQTDLSEAWKDCDTITQLPLLNLSTVTNLESAWENCINLQFVPPKLFNNCPATNLTNAFSNCSLSEDSVDNILVSLDEAGGDNGTIDITGGSSSPPSNVGDLAKSNLELRGWTVNVPAGAVVSFVDVGEEIYALTSFGDGRVFAGAYYGSVYKSTDYGVTFDSGTSVTSDIRAIAACGGNTIITGGWDYSYPWISTDGGTTWLEGPDFDQSEIDSIIYAGDGVIYIGTYGYINKSIDNALTWLPSLEPLNDSYYVSLALPGANKIVAGTYSSGYFAYSSDGGQTWGATDYAILGPGLEESIYGLASNGLGTVIASTDGDGRVFRSSDSGETWDTGIQLGAATEVYCLTFSPNGYFYAGTNDDGRIYSSSNGGLTWEEFFDPGIIGGYVYALTTSGGGTLIASIDTFIYSIPISSPAQEIPVTQVYPSSSVPSDLVKSDVAGITGSSPVINIVSLSQADYDSLSIKDPSTLYVIVN